MSVSKLFASVAAFARSAAVRADVSSAVIVAAVPIIPLDTLAAYVQAPTAAAATAPIRARQSGARVLTLRFLAHDYPMEDSLSGRLLAATPQLADPNFRPPLVLIVEDDKDERTLRPVLNRPTALPL